MTRTEKVATSRCKRLHPNRPDKPCDDCQQIAATLVAQVAHKDTHDS